MKFWTSIFIFCLVTFFATQGSSQTFNYSQGGLQISVFVSNPCNGSNNGFIRFTVINTADAQPAKLQVILGPANYFIQTPISVGGSFTFNASNTLAAGLYNFIIADNTGSDVINTFPASGVTLSALPNLVVNEVTRTDNTDCSSPNGSVIASVSGGSKAPALAVPGSFTYTWTSSNGLAGLPLTGSFDGTSNLNLATQLSLSGLPGGTYTLNIQDNYSTCTQSRNFTISDPSPALYNITSGSGTACSGSNFTITLNGSDGAVPAPGTSYTIIRNGTPTALTFPGTGTGPFNMNFPTAGFTNGDVLTVRASNGFCTPRLMTGSVTLGITSSPTAATLGGTATICSGQSTNLSVAITGGTAPFSFTITGLGLVTGYAAGAPISVNPVSTTIYTLSGLVTDANGCTVTGTGTASVTVNPTPTATISALPTALCAGNSSTLTFNLTGTGPFNVNYSDGASSFNLSGISNGHTVSVSPPVTRTYTITGISDASSCIGTPGSNVTIAVNPPPTSAVLSGTATICAGQSTNLSVAIIGGTPPYSFTVANLGLVGGYISGSALAVSPLVNTSYSIIGNVTDANGCTAVSVSGSAAITVNPLPNTSTITGPSPVCANTAGTGYSVASTAGSTYAWVITGGTQASGTNTNSITVDWGTAGAGNVQVTETNAAGCVGTAVNLSVTINTATTSSITGPSPVCANTTGTGYSVASTAGSTYAWVITGGTQASGANTNSITVDWGAAGAGNVQVTETNAAGCVGTPVNLSVSITASPVTSSITGPSPVCANTTGTGYSVASTAGSTYAWVIAGGTQASGMNTNSITVDWGAAGAGNVQVTETNAAGCVGTAVNLSVTINTATTSSITGPSPVCANTTGTGYSVASTAGSTYAWVITGGTQASGANTNSITVDWGAAGAGNVQVTETNAAGCVGTPVNLSVSITASPVTSSITGPSPVCANTTGTGYSVASTAGSTYAWVIAGGTQASGMNTNSITVDWGAAGAGNVQVTETNAAGCVGTPVNLSVSITASPVTSSITGPSPVCANTTGTGYSVASTAGSTYAWVIAGGTQASGTNTNSITVDWGAAGAGNVQVTETNAAGCVGTLVNLSVSINASPVTSSITGSNSVCANATGVVYSVINNLGSTYSWVITGGTQATGGNTNSITVDWAAAGAGNVSVTETNGCTGPAVNLPITINANPTSAVLTGNASICAGQSTPLTVTIMGGVSPYSFNITGIGSITGFISSVATPIIVTPPTSTTYTLSGNVTDANGCVVAGSGSAFVNVGTITPSTGPGIDTWIGDVYDDTGNSAPFYFLGVDFAPAKYRGFIDETEIVGFGTSSYDPTTDKFDLDFAPGHSVLLQGANLCKSYNKNYSIKFRMTKSLAAGAYTFRVSSDDGVRLFIDGNPVTFVIPTIPTAFADHGYVTFTSDQFCLSAGPHSFVLDFYQNLGDSRVTFDYDFVANPVTSVSVVSAPSSTTICAGTNVVFTATGVNGGSTPVFQWKKNGVNVGTNSATYSDAALANGDVITVDLTSSLTCAVPSSVTSTPITMTVNPIPSAPSVASPVVVCQGTSVDLALSVTPVGTATLLWYTAAVGGIGNAAAPSTSSLPTDTTNFFVSQIDLGCESARALLEVQVNPSPIAPGVSNINYCVAAVAVPLTATGANLLWYSTSTGGVGTVVAPTPSTAIAGTTSFFVSQSVSGCESPRAQLDVTVIGPPDNSLAVSPSISNLCTGGSTTIDIVGTQVGVDYQLFDGTSLIGSPVAGGGNISISTGTLIATTTFSVVASYNPANGCSPPITLLNTASITVGGSLNAGLTVAPLLGTLCSGNSTSVRISNSEVNVNYQLRNNTTNTAVGAPVAGTGGSIDLPTGVLATSTSFNVLATSATCSLQLTSLANVVVLPPPNATLTIVGPPSPICPNTSTNITIANSENGVSYQLRLSPSNTNVGSSAVGTGGTLSLATPILTLNTSFNVLAIVGSCNAQLANTVNVSLLPPGDPSCTVTGNCATVIITPLPTPATCTLSNGSIFFSISPPTPTINNTGVKITITGQSITNGSIARTNLNNPSFSGLPLGLYSYTIEYGDASCTKTGFVTIDQSGTVGAPTASNIIGPKCAGSATGSINLDVPGETGNLLQWSLDGITFTNFTAGNTISGIPSGPAPTFQRVISVRRNASDPCFAAVTITMQDANPAITVAPPTITDATCANNDGAITIGTIAGGVGPYTFRFDSVAYATLPTGSKFSNLTGGTHKFTVIDNVGCEKYFKYVVNFPGFVNTTSPVLTQPDCAGQGANGTIAFTILSAGTFTVGYTTDPIAQPATFVNYGTLNILLQGLSKGDYYVWIKPNTAACATKLAVQTITGSITQVSFDAPQLNCNTGFPEIRITNIKAAPSAMTIQITKKGLVTPDRTISLPTVPAGSLYVIKGNELPSTKGDYTINILQTQGTCTVASSSFDFAYNGVLAVSVQNIKSSYPDLPTGGLDLINFTGGQKPYFVTIRFDSASNPQINPLDFTPRTEEVTDLNNSLQYIKSYKALHAGRYHLTVNEDGGCSYEFDVRVPLDFTFDPNTIPNVFTPNGDGSNETFYIRNIPPDTQVSISNRWGAEVFSSKSYQNNWTGDNYPDGVYFYRVNAGGNTFTGWVEIIRGR